jgi:hypothetical protein
LITERLAFRFVGDIGDVQGNVAAGLLGPGLVTVQEVLDTHVPGRSDEPDAAGFAHDGGQSPGQIRGFILFENNGGHVLRIGKGLPVDQHEIYVRVLSGEIFNGLGVIGA